MEPLNLSPELLEALEREAQTQGLSREELIRKTLERLVQDVRSKDPLFADKAVWHGPTPSDCALNHDEYLYGDRE